MGQKPQADYYVGRPVIGVSIADEEIAPYHDWGVTLEGNVRIYNDDPENTVTEEELDRLEGTQLLRVILSEKATRLQFGRTKQDGTPPEIFGELAYTPGAYKIADSEFGGPVTPQRTDDHENLMTPDEPTDRIAKGPLVEEEEIEEREEG